MMPTDAESLLIYAIVLLTAGWMGWRWWRASCNNRNRPCGRNCGCEPPKRHPLIQKLVDRGKK